MSLGSLEVRPWGELFWVEPYDKHFNTKGYLLSKEKAYQARLEDTPGMAECLEANCQQYNINQRWVIARGALEQQIWKWPNTAKDFDERMSEMLGFRLWDKSYLGWENQIAGCCKALRTQYLNPDDQQYYVKRFIAEGVQMVHGSKEKLYPTNLGEALNMRYNPSESGLASFSRVYRSWFPDYVQYGMVMYDKTVSEWAKPSVLWAQTSGYMKGYSEEDFGGKDPLTREQAAALLQRLLKKEQ